MSKKKILFIARAAMVGIKYHHILNHIARAKKCKEFYDSSPSDLSILKLDLERIRNITSITRKGLGEAEYYQKRKKYPAEKNHLDQLEMEQIASDRTGFRDKIRCRACRRHFDETSIQKLVT